MRAWGQSILDADPKQVHLQQHEENAMIIFTDASLSGWGVVLCRGPLLETAGEAERWTDVDLEVADTSAGEFSAEEKNLYSRRARAVVRAEVGRTSFRIPSFKTGDYPH